MKMIHMILIPLKKTFLRVSGKLLITGINEILPGGLLA